MKIVTRQETGEVRISESLVVRILGICAGGVKLGFTTQRVGSLENDPVDQLAQIRSPGRGYYQFSQNGDRMLVLELTKGQSVALNESVELAVLETRRVGATLAIYSISEYQQYMEGVAGAHERFDHRFVNDNPPREQGSMEIPASLTQRATM